MSVEFARVRKNYTMSFGMVRAFAPGMSQNHRPIQHGNARRAQLHRWLTSIGIDFDYRHPLGQFEVFAEHVASTFAIRVPRPMHGRLHRGHHNQSGTE